MTNPHTSPTDQDPTHDIVFSRQGEAFGFMFQNGVASFRETPISPPSKIFSEEQKSWVAGLGRPNFRDEPTGFYDSTNAWTMSEGVFPGLRYHYGRGLQPVQDQDLVWEDGSWLQDYADSVCYTSKFRVQQLDNTTPIITFFTQRGNQTYNRIGIFATGAGTATVKLATDINFSSLIFSENISVSSSTTFLWNWKSISAPLSDGTPYYIGITGASSVYVLLEGGGYYGESYRPWYRLERSGPKVYFFEYDGALYAVSAPSDGSSSTLYINGDRGTSTGGNTSSTLNDTSKTWDNKKFFPSNSYPGYSGAMIKIVSGTGAGQTRRIETSLTNQVFVNPNWDIIPDNTSQYVIYNSWFWTPVTISGTSLAAVSAPPIVVNSLILFPQGSGTDILRVRFNGTEHTGEPDTGNKAERLCVAETLSDGPKVFRALNGVVSYSSPPTYGGAPMAFTDITGGAPIGSTAYKITNLFPHENAVYVLKENEVYRILGDDTSVELDNRFSDVLHPENGISATSHNKMLYLAWGGSILQIGTNMVTDLLNYKAGLEPSRYIGRPVDITSGLGWVFVAMKYTSESTTYSRVLAWNGFGWHTVYNAPMGTSISSIRWQSNPGAAPFLWICQDGVPVFIPFPIDTASPLRSIHTRVHTRPNILPSAEIVTPVFDLGERAVRKYVDSIDIISENLTVSTPEVVPPSSEVIKVYASSVDVYYQVDDGISDNKNWYYAGEVSVSPFANIPLNLGNVYRIRFKISIFSAYNNYPARIFAVRVNGVARYPTRYQWNFVFKVGSNIENLHGDNDDPDAQIEFLNRCAANAYPVIMSSVKPTLHDKTVIIEPPTTSMNYSDAGEWDGTIWVTARE